MPLGNPYHPYNRLAQSMKEKEMLRSDNLTKQETINQLEEENDTLRREGTRFDDLLRKEYQDIDTMRGRYL
jgi:predicted nuclease with TOPRIM domain